MCGFTGFWDYKAQLSIQNMERVTRHMSMKIDHRGPDEEGIWAHQENGIALGHRRLSIVDLSPTGSQPMHSASGQSVIIYNGEIYNAPEIRRELEATGINFRGTSDTEVILEAVEQWGVVAASQKFIGMFSFAQWDKRNKVLHLSRDRLGIKPLYWGFVKDVLFFGSQLKSFYPHPSFEKQVSEEAVASYLKYNYIPAPLSIYKNIFKLKPGCTLSIDFKKQVKEHCFWSLQDVIKEAKSNPITEDAEAIQGLHDLLKDAVKRRMIADVPLGAFLSGGIDSSLVVSLMQSQSSNPVKTFTIGFTEDAFNEAPYAKQIAKHLGTAHTELYVSSKEAMATLPSMTSWFDEPFADSSQIPTYLVSKLAQQHVKVSLSGDGGDELFGGYSRYKFMEKIWKPVKKVPLPFRNLMAKTLTTVSPKIWETLLQPAKHIVGTQNIGNKIQKIAKVLKSNNLSEAYECVVENWESLALAGQKNLHQPLPHPTLPLNDLEIMEYLDILTYLPDDILTKVDRASMAVSLEARVPLLDHRVVAYSWQLPTSMKIRKNQTKWILRQILKDYIPESFFDRPKSGFGIPLGSWLKHDLRDWTESLLNKSSLDQHGLLDYAAVQNQWQRHLDGRMSAEYSLWGVLMFQAWWQDHMTSEHSLEKHQQIG